MFTRVTLFGSIVVGSAIGLLVRSGGLPGQEFSVSVPATVGRAERSEFENHTIGVMVPINLEQAQASGTNLNLLVSLDQKGMQDWQFAPEVAGYLVTAKGTKISMEPEPGVVKSKSSPHKLLVTLDDLSPEKYEIRVYLQGVKDRQPTESDVARAIDILNTGKQKPVAAEFKKRPK